MAGFAAVLVVVGILGLLYGAVQRHKLGRITKAPFVKTGEVAANGAAVAGPKGAISVEGDVQCAQLLTSPVTGTPCLYYQVEVNATWKQGETSRSKKLADEKTATQFTVNDGSGPVPIDAMKGGDFDLDKSFDETRGTGLVGILGQEITMGNLRVSTASCPLGAKYHVVEKVLKPQPKLFVCGKVGDAGNAIGAPGWTSLILSTKTRDQILGATGKSAKMSLMIGSAAAGVGMVVGVISHFV